MSFWVRISPLLFLVTLPLAAQASTFCCEANGKTYCDDGIPPACSGKAYRQLNQKGVVIRHYAAPLTPEQRIQKEAELARQRVAEEKRAEQDRQDRKLIGTYATLSDMDIGHERLLSDLRKGQQQMEKRLAEAEKHKLKLSNEAEFYKKGKMPDELKTQIDRNEQDIQTQK